MSTCYPISYQVYITPLVDRNTYGDIVDVSADIDMSDYILKNGIGKIKRQIDNGDYDIGVFAYDSITLKAINFDGKFSDQQDSRSIFKYTRDKAKVFIKFIDSNSDATISFKGIINEEGSRQDYLKGTVSFKVLSLDSVIRKTKVSGGSVTTSMLFSDAIKNILNVPDITSVLTFDETEINVGLDLLIDDGSWFDNKTTKEALDALMVVSGSVMYIDENDKMIVKTREENSGDIFYFWGAGDLLGRENIINITNYNTGLHRTFNSIMYGDNVEVNDENLVKEYGVRQKKIDYDFITNDTKKTQISNNILTEFKAPKIEMEIETITETVKSLKLFDLVSVDMKPMYIPYDGSKLPVYGAAKYGTGISPRSLGDLIINQNFAFKVIGFEEDPKNFTSKIKLRQRGISISDEVFTEFLTLYGDAIYGEDVYQENSDYVDPDYNSVYGAGKYGTVHYGAI